MEEKKCTGNCGMNYCDDNGCIERKRHYVDQEERPEQVHVLLSHGAVASVDKNCSPETLKALDEMVKLAYNQIDSTKKTAE